MVQNRRRRKFNNRKHNNTTNNNNSSKPSNTESGEITAHITFTFDKELKVKIDSNVRDDFISVLIKNGIIAKEDVNDKTLLHYAMVMLANDVTDQVITNINDPDGYLFFNG